MRGVVFNGERELELIQFPDPTPDPHDVVIEMKASGIDRLFTHRWAIDQAEEAYKLFDKQVDGKGVFLM